MSLLDPAVSRKRDHIEGADFAHFAVVVFGAVGAPESRRLGTVLGELRRRHGSRLRTVWRHCPGTTRSARLSGVTRLPTLFVGDARYDGPLDASAISAALLQAAGGLAKGALK